MLIDTHAHILDDALDAEAIVSSMSEDELSAIVIAGVDLPSSERAARFAALHSGIYCTVGCHPEECGAYDCAHDDKYLELAALPSCVAIGEVGLDYHYDDGASPAVQRDVLARMLHLAHKADLPIVLHVRDAYKDSLDVLRGNRALLGRGFVMHCYGGSAELVKDYCDLGAYFSLGGVITFKNARKDDVVRAIPTDRLMLETDCPYMTPEPYRGRPNRPAYVRYVALKMAQILGKDYEQVCSETSANAARIFYKLGL